MKKTIISCESREDIEWKLWHENHASDEYEAKIIQKYADWFAHDGMTMKQYKYWKWRFLSELAENGYPIDYWKNNVKAKPMEVDA